MLKKDPNKRINFDDLSKHAFIQDIKKKKIGLIENNINDINNNTELNENNYDGFIKNIKNDSKLLKLKELIKIENNEVFYSSNIFNFSQYKNLEDTSSSEEVESNLKKSWFIAELAFLIDYSCESLSLYYKALEILFSILKKKSFSQNCERTIQIVKWIKFRIVEFLEYSNEILSKIENKYFVCIEELIYVYILKLVKKNIHLIIIIKNNNIYKLIINIILKLNDSSLNYYLNKDENFYLKMERCKYLSDYLCFNCSIELIDKEKIGKSNYFS
jgi:hypothetical protein